MPSKVGQAYCYHSLCSHGSVESGALTRMQKIKVREVVKSEVMLVHSEELWNKVYETMCRLTHLSARVELK